MGAYAKAIVGAIVAGLGVLATGLDDDAISGQEWIYSGIAFLTALGAIWAVPNSEPGP